MIKMKFEISDIQDVRIIIKAKDKHFDLIPFKKHIEIAKKIRIEIGKMALYCHKVIDLPLEDINKE